jgi:hypothetical protein
MRTLVSRAALALALVLPCAGIALSRSAAAADTRARLAPSATVLTIDKTVVRAVMWWARWQLRGWGPRVP